MQTWLLLLLVKTNDFGRGKEGDRLPDTVLRAIALSTSKIAQLSPYIEQFFYIMYPRLCRREPSLHSTWGDRSVNLKNRPTFTLYPKSFLQYDVSAPV
ncbi:hypothetical protein SD81_007680 [Tolypothrix campylonemoides VB511288]|nr:hypothetical protein SD81_007680 [Tolypothrix campylonemoides VB511288]